MKYLFDSWKDVKRGLENKRIFVFLDYDGTLTPIAKTPSKAFISPEARSLLKRLLKNGACKIAVISGRGLGDIKKMVGVSGIIYVGNHGLEIEGPKLRFKSPLSPGFLKILEKIGRELREALSAIKGAIVEHKGLTLSVHYRMADKKDALAVKNFFYEVMEPYIVKNEAHVTFGKKVFEVRPPMRWDKGKAVMWLLARQRFAKRDAVKAVYIGDDVTDEDAFRVLRDKGLTIVVGRPLLSCAQYYLNNPGEVASFLKKIVLLCKE
ncbi:MAG: trehalose-phosphatase [Candidatus Omnitrophica bacterium]|nr:trehalose-phosphatase [Candidatus Omnitrophota bacterium]